MQLEASLDGAQGVQPAEAEVATALAVAVVPLCALAVTSTAVGMHWDICWHQSIGRDTFWSPPHLAIQFGAVLTGLCCLHVLWRATFGAAHVRVAARGASVRVWGLRGPLGVFVAGWGGVAMLTSAPFDDWWHNTYGLDVKVLSPPHAVLVGGILVMQLGVLLLVLGERNRTAPDTLAHSRHDSLLLHVCGMALTCYLVLTLELLLPSYMHSGLFFRTVAMGVPLLLAVTHRASGQRWACTQSVGTYTALMLLLVWVFPLFPATPRLGPVYLPVTHLVPPPFPLLLIVPAVVLDVLLARVPGWSDGRRAFWGGTLFLASFALAQWPFADFLMSPWARNPIFAADMFGYSTQPGSYAYRHLFHDVEGTSTRFFLNLALAWGLSVGMFRLGLASGTWLLRLRR
ncbi:hypothetical protein JGU66_32390 [Myxococcaceae bacterium JPH2]|nr:hypothetical protein [Myxococcaceae bacterium JPH2]